MTYHPSILGAWLAHTLIAAVAFGQVFPGPAEHSSGSVTLHLVDSYGGPLAASDVRKITVLNRAGEDVSPKNFEGTLQDLPYGDYSVRLSVPGFRDWIGTLHIGKPITWQTVGMQLGGIEGEPMCALSGTLVGFKRTSAPVWIRLIQLYSNDILESEVDSRGSFKIPWAPCGKYILAVMGDDQSIRLITVTLRLQMEPLSIPFGDSQQ